MTVSERPYGEITEAVLGFWFEDDWVPGYCEYRPLWFERIDPAFDRQIVARFGDIHQHLAGGKVEAMANHAEGALAAVIVLDQFSRNMFRGQASRYDFDLKARGLAERSLDRGDAATLSPLRRCFLYMPFQHSEDLNDQARAVALFEGLASTPLYRQFVASAREHREIIRRFGRFPNRNEVLGRQTTAAEAEFLAASTCVHLKSA